MKLSGWGRYPILDCRCVTARTRIDAIDAIAVYPSLIARGLGRSYGDAALNPAGTLAMPLADRLIAFDEKTGRVECEAGVALSDLLRVFVPRGWFPPVTPGTKHVTIGGMIAADVHGKNHHRDGSFGSHVERLTLADAGGRVVECSPTENAELFQATVGSMGLTGVILSAVFRMIPIETAYIRQETRGAANLGEALELLERGGAATYSVAWINCLAGGAAEGRSIVFSGEHARRGEVAEHANPTAIAERRGIGIPLDAPGWALSSWTIRAFNELYFRTHRRPRVGFVDYDRFFYPLDSLRDWNRLYGRRGFVQYQCVLPKAAGRAGLARILRSHPGRRGGLVPRRPEAAGAGRGFLSFPIEGYTLALDFPANARCLALLETLDAIVADCGGRIYLAKDARAPRAIVERGYPDIDRFRQLRAAAGAHAKFRSSLSDRLGL